MRTEAAGFLGIAPTKLDELFMETICSNLYGDLALILQIIVDKGKRPAFFWGEFGVTEKERERTSDRVMRRLRSDRIETLEDLKKISDNENIYRAPVVMPAYRDILLVQKEKNDDIYVSTIFTNIFRTVFYETAEQIEDKFFKKTIRQIRRYRLWEFSSHTFKHLAKIYQEVCFSKNKYKHAEVVFLEKLFGILTLNEIFEKNFKKKELTYVIKSMGRMHLLGYTNMTKLIASKINFKNHHIVEEIIDMYIYPLCSECILTILNDVILYVFRIEIKERQWFVEKLLDDCLNNTAQINDILMTKCIQSDCLPDMFKTMFDIPKDDEPIVEDIPPLITYLTTLRGSYIYSEYVNNDSDNDKKAIRRINIVNNMCYQNLSYLHENIDTGNVWEQLTEEDFKDYRDL